MAKDPAVLWYWNDWYGGTFTLTRHLKGCYMDLLYAQFNSGRLSLAQVKTVLGGDYGLAWPLLQEKFKKDDNGNFFNARAELEKDKRVSFSNKQSERVKKRWGTDSGNTVVLPKKANVNGNEIVIKNGFGKSENLLFTIEHCAEVAMGDERWVGANKTNRDELKQFNRILEQIGEYEKNPADYKRHFAYLKIKNPDRVKPLAKVFTTEELREMALEWDRQDALNKQKNG